MSNESENDGLKANIKRLKPSPRQFRSIGAIAVNLNKFESQMFLLFSHHYELRGMGTPMAWHLWHLLQENKRGKALTELFTTLDKPPVCEHVQHVIDYFAICNANRNHIFHTPHMPLFDSPMLMLAKATKENWHVLNMLLLPDRELREIAEAIDAGSTYAFMVLRYLKKRDMPNYFPAAMLRLFPDTLPQKPALPPNLNLAQIPRAQVVPPNLFGGQSKESESH